MNSAVWALGEKASALILAGRPAAAVPLLTRCAAAGAGWALLLRGRAKYALGKPELAEADVTRAFDLESGCGWIFGLSTGPLKIPPGGERLYDANRRFRDERGGYAARAFHGKLAIMAGFKRKGLAHLDWAAKAAPKRPYLFAWRAEARRRLGDLKGARSDAKRALALDRRHGVAWTTLAAVERVSGRPGEALKAAKRAVACAPAYEIAYLEAARSCLALRDVPGTLTWLERAARRSSRLGWASLGEGRAAPAPDPESLLADAPWRGRLLAWCGEDALAHGDVARALSFLNGAADPPFASTWRGQALLALGDAAGAERALKAAVAATPRYARAWVALTQVRFALRRPRPALAACERALKLEPDWAWALYQRGRVLGALGRRDAAVRDLDACLTLDGRFEQARAERATILKDGVSAP